MPMIKLSLDKKDLPAEFTNLQTHDIIEYKLYAQGYHKFCY